MHVMVGWGKGVGGGAGVRAGNSVACPCLVVPRRVPNVEYGPPVYDHTAVLAVIGCDAASSGGIISVERCRKSEYNPRMLGRVLLLLCCAAQHITAHARRPAGGPFRFVIFYFI